MRGLLDAGVERVQKELAGQPEVQAEILTVIGRIYRRLGRLRQGAAAARTGARRRAAGLRAGARTAWPRRLNDLGVLLSEMSDYAGARREPGAGAEHAAPAPGPGARRRRHHAGGARARLSGSGPQRVARNRCIVKRWRSGGSCYGERTPRYRHQLERSGVGPAAEWRPAGRRVAAPAVPGDQPEDARGGPCEHLPDPARPGVDPCRPRRPRRRRIAAARGADRGPQDVGRQASERGGGAQQSVSNALRTEEVRRSGGRASGAP